MRDLNLNRCNDATVRTREVPIVHASLLYHVHAIALRKKWFTNCGTSGNRALGTSLVVTVRTGLLSPVVSFHIFYTRQKKVLHHLGSKI